MSFLRERPLWVVPWRRRPASIISSTSRFYLVSHSTHLAETRSLGLHTSYLLTNKERGK